MGYEIMDTESCSLLLLPVFRMESFVEKVQIYQKVIAEHKIVPESQLV